MTATITPLEALRRLIAAVKLIDFADCKDERAWNQLGGELGVAEGVVRDWNPDPAAWAAESTTGGAVRMLTKISLLESEVDRYVNREDMAAIGCNRVKVPLYRTPVAAQPSEAVPQKLRDIGQQIRTQDDDYTADAMYVVERKRILTGLDTDFSQGPEDIVWCIEDSMIFQYDAEFDALERDYEDYGIIPQNYTRTGFSDSWDLVTVFFTRADAEAFIERHGHKYDGVLRFTIECEVRNDQWRAIREWLMSLAASPTAAVSAAPSGDVEIEP